MGLCLLNFSKKIDTGLSAVDEIASYKSGTVLCLTPAYESSDTYRGHIIFCAGADNRHIVRRK